MFFSSPSQGIKRPGRDTDFSPPYNVELTNDRSCTFGHPYALVANNEATLPLIYQSYKEYFRGGVWLPHVMGGEGWVPHISGA